MKYFHRTEKLFSFVRSTSGYYLGTVGTALGSHRKRNHYWL